MKRTVCFLLLVMGLIVFTGCADEPEPVQKISSVIDNTRFSQHLNISIGFWNIHDMVNSQRKDAVLTGIEEFFNVSIEPISVSWENYKERYQILSSTNSLPDIFANLTISSNDNNDSAMLNTLIENRSIRSLPEDLSVFPNLKSMFGKLDYTRSTDGKYYVIPRTSFYDPVLGSSDVGMVVRKDWMENLGLKAPENLNEFTELVSAFANQDPDGNGIDDTIGYNVNNRDALGKWLILGIAPECNIYSWIKTDKGYIPSYLTENFKSVVTAYRTLYETGGLDPDFYVKKSTDGEDDFAHGILGALEYKASPSAIMQLEARWKLYQDKPFEECITLLNIFPAPDGKYYSNSSNLFWSETLISSAVDDEKMERILYLYDFLLSEEGWYLTRYGIEGTDYTYDNGEFKCLIDTSSTNISKALENKYPSLELFSCLASWGGSWNDFEINEINTLRFGKYAVEISNKALRWNVEKTVPVERPFDFLLMPKESTEKFSTSTVIDDFTRVIIGSGDPVKMWEKQIEIYYQNGLEDYIKRQNELFINRR